MELIERIQSQENSDTYSVAFLEKEREVSNLIFTAFLVPASVADTDPVWKLLKTHLNLNLI